MKNLFVIILLTSFGLNAQVLEESSLYGKWRNTRNYLYYEFRTDSLVISWFNPFETSKVVNWKLSNDTLMRDNQSYKVNIKNDTLTLDFDFSFVKIRHSEEYKKKFTGQWINELGTEIVEFANDSILYNAINSRLIHDKWKLKDGRVFFLAEGELNWIEVTKIDKDSLIFGKPHPMSFSRLENKKSINIRKLKNTLVGNNYILEGSHGNVKLNFTEKFVTFNEHEFEWQIITRGNKVFIRIDQILLKIDNLNKDYIDISVFELFGNESGYHLVSRDIKMIKNR
ncbi:hypothetical protein [Natronoflexus pectinivorans]|uniref:Lipocalin-like protein n=1 Tax=Natronoflexus pectinivorans TaxID=682526 RepID=A0A4V2RUV6_9BACT|nr:hypothetical protein [Natronoflexus pectinivorans]TCO01944.1 hypothetical protein EV194_1297 [Natronoflexus pectinivorans]